MDPLRADAIYNERHVKVICVGAGASGLCLAYKLQRSFRSYSLTIYDKNPEIGGTWYENKYPGCACDVPSHNYAYSFAPKADYTSVYASSTEIKGYFTEFVKKYGFERYLRLSHMIQSATWDEHSGQWNVEVKDLNTGEIKSDWCHIMVHATGYLNVPSWPAMPGLADYEGIKLHSAKYDTNVSLKDKNVLLIGAGSSAVQILPVIQPIVKSLKILIRSPTWILPTISTEASVFTPEQVAKFIAEPETLLRRRRENEQIMNSIFTMYMKNTILQQQARTLLETEMRKILDDENLEEKLIPTFSVGCKRVIPGGFPYLKALKSGNVTPIFSGVREFTRSGVISEDGSKHDGDVIICATGFDTSYISRYPIIGPEGRNLQTEWSGSIMGYMGVGISEWPNTFTMLGPYTPVSNGATMSAIEAQSEYICAFIDRFQTEPIHSLAPKREVCEDFKAHVASVMEKLVWTDDCRNSHKNGTLHGRVPTTWPGSTLHYLEAIREPRWDDWEVKYTGNRFSWLGDGISQTEWDPTADLGYYIKRDDEDDAWLSRWRRNAVVSRSGTMPHRELHRQAKLAVEPQDGEQIVKLNALQVPMVSVSELGDDLVSGAEL